MNTHSSSTEDFTRIAGYDELQASEKERLQFKEYFGVLPPRDSVRLNPETGELELRYYSNNDKTSLTAVRFSDLKTVRSENDDKYKQAFRTLCWKHGLAIFLSCLLLPTLLLTFFLQNEMKLDMTMSLIVLTIYGISMYIIDNVLWRNFNDLHREISNNFVASGAQWSNAIKDCLTDDSRTRMTGIRNCLLRFRQFIKWRRYLNFFSVMQKIFSYTILVGSIIASIGLSLLIVWIVGIDVFYSETGIALGFGAAAISAVTVRYLFNKLFERVQWFEGTVKLYTEFRDPTVQLSVMIAEMHRALVLKTLA